MTGVAFNFDATQVPFAEASLPVWEGPVPVQILRSEVKPTAAGGGNNMLIYTVGALAGEYRGQENVIRLNLWNHNAQAVDIAQRQLSSISHVTGRLSWQHTDQLVGGQFLSVWAKEPRELVDQQTGQKRMVESCQCKDFKFLDGRTIREAQSGQPASMPYDPNVRHSGVPSPAPQVQQQPPMQPQMQPGGAPQMQQQFGQSQPPAQGQFQPPGAAPGGQPGFQPPMQPPGAAPQAMAQPGGPANAGFAMGQPGPQPMHPGAATGTVGFAGSPAAPQGAPQGGFSPPMQQPQGQPSFQPPGTPQAGSGPWGPQR